MATGPIAAAGEAALSGPSADGASAKPAVASVEGSASIDGTWQGGWLTNARKVESPNFGARPAGTGVSLALVHSISLPPGVYGGDAIERLFTNRLDWDAHPYFQQIRGLAVSSHFMIRRDGELLQFVSVDDRAWHAGRSSWLGHDECNDFSVGIELEGLEGETFEAAQYGALCELLNALKTQFSITSVAGHEHVAPGRKLDPGPGFDWPFLIATLDWPDVIFPPSAASPRPR